MAKRKMTDLNEKQLHTVTLPELIAVVEQMLLSL
jgi:hypothetical protein